MFTSYIPIDGDVLTILLKILSFPTSHSPNFWLIITTDCYLLHCNQLINLMYTFRHFFFTFSSMKHYARAAGKRFVTKFNFSLHNLHIRLHSATASPLIKLELKTKRHEADIRCYLLSFHFVQFNVE